MRHPVGLQPQTHTVVGAEKLCLAHTADTLQPWLDIYLDIVVEESLVKTVVGRIQCESQKLGVLLFLSGDTGLGGFRRELAKHSVDTVLYVDSRHVSVGTLLEIDHD